MFGEIQDGKMYLNHAGLMTIKWYQALPSKFTNLQCDEFICMPNHIHFIVNILELDTPQSVGAHPRVRPIKKRDNPDMGETHLKNEFPVQNSGQTRGSAPTKIPIVIQWYKTMTTNEYIRGVKQNRWPPFNGKLWQRNYWEHVIRNEIELNQIREYIQTNPMSWELDKLFTNESGRQQNLMEEQHNIGADPCVCPIKKREHPSIDPRYSKNTIPLQTTGQTRGSAPTEKSPQKTEVLTS
jgi:REP element-mobilizing transposase RayT